MGFLLSPHLAGFTEASTPAPAGSGRASFLRLWLCWTPHHSIIALITALSLYFYICPAHSCTGWSSHVVHITIIHLVHTTNCTLFCLYCTFNSYCNIYTPLSKSVNNTSMYSIFNIWHICNNLYICYSPLPIILYILYNIASLAVVLTYTLSVNNYFALLVRSELHFTGFVPVFYTMTIKWNPI